MKTRTLNIRKHGPLDLTELGFGGAPLGNLYRALPEEQAQETLDAAFSAGIRYFDTAPLYGMGLSEERFGSALERFGSKSVVLSTKIGRVLREAGGPEDVPQVGFVETPIRTFDFDYTYDGVMRSYEQSLARLGVDRIDILYVHDVDIWTHKSKEASDAKLREVMDSGYRALEKLRDAGDVKAIGAGVNEWEICDWLMRRGDFDCFLLAGRYTLLEQAAGASFLPECVARGVGIVLGGAYNSGILATGPIEGAYYNYAPASKDVLDRVRAIEKVCEAHDTRLVEAALHFVLAHPAIVSVIPGAARPEEVGRNVEVLDAAPPPELWTALKERGFIREDAPVPGLAG